MNLKKVYERKDNIVRKPQYIVKFLCYKLQFSTRNIEEMIGFFIVQELV